MNGPLEENAYFFHLESSGQGVLVDPGAEAERLDAVLEKSKLTPTLIVATHGHFDHIGQVHYFQKKYGAPFAMHPGDSDLLDVLPDNYAFYGMGDTQPPVVDQEMSDGQILETAGLALKVIHTPGHSPGGVCLYHEESGSLFSGDTLFKGSVGRSDFPGGDGPGLIKAIHEKLLVLPEPTRVYPGHGPASTIGEEKNRNPFLLDK